MSVKQAAQRIIDAKSQGESQMKAEIRSFIDDLFQEAQKKMAGGSLETCKAAMREADNNWRSLTIRVNKEGVGMNEDAFRDMTKAINPAIAEQMNWS